MRTGAMRQAKGILDMRHGHDGAASQPKETFDNRLDQKDTTRMWIGADDPHFATISDVWGYALKLAFESLPNPEI